MTTSGAFVNRSNNEIDLDLDAANQGSEAEKAARSSAEAVLRTLKPWFDEAATTVEIESIELASVGESEAVLVKVLYGQEETVVPLVGAALIEKKDPGQAAARAVLIALNRKLSLISAELVLEPRGT